METDHRGNLGGNEYYSTREKAEKAKGFRERELEKSHPGKSIVVVIEMELPKGATLME